MLATTKMIPQGVVAGKRHSSPNMLGAISAVAHKSNAHSAFASTFLAHEHISVSLIGGLAISSFSLFLCHVQTQGASQ